MEETFRLSFPCPPRATDALRPPLRFTSKECPVPDAIVERDGHVMTITMNRPERYNALTGAMLIRMYDAYEEASNDPDVRCIIVTGAGGNFCSGADLKGMSGDAGNEDPEIDASVNFFAAYVAPWWGPESTTTVARQSASDADLLKELTEWDLKVLARLNEKYDQFMQSQGDTTSEEAIGTSPH